MVAVRRLVVLLLVAAAGAASPEAVRLNEEGLVHLEAGRPAEALSAFEEALRLQPGDGVLARNAAAALAALADRRLDAKRPAEAIAFLDRALALHPERLRYRLLRGRARFREGSAGNRLGAIEDFLAVLEGDPDHVDALVNLAQIAYLERRLDDAVLRLERAAALKPGDADILARLEKARREQAVEAGYEALESAAVQVRYGPSVARPVAESVLGICEEAKSRLTNRFQHWPDARTAITLYSPAEFRSATQVHGWVAGLSDGTIRLTVHAGVSMDALRATIYHEFTHHLVRGLAPKAPVWLHEGLAQIAEEKSVPRAEARLRRGREPAGHELDAPVLAQKDPRLVSRFYDIALAFTSYLRELQGDSGVRRLLDLMEEAGSVDAVMREVYGAPRSELFARWLVQLRAG